MAPPPVIETLATGDEVVNGDVVDTNSAQLSRAFLRMGLSVRRHNALPDDAELLVSGLREISVRADLCVVTGGLGPTEDDLTADVVAEVLGVPVAIHEESVARMKERFAKLGYRFTENNRRSARYPEGASVYLNEVGTAPAFSTKIGRCQFFFLPGVPKEFQFFLETHLLPWARSEWTDSVTVVRQLKLLGWGESHLAEKLADFTQRYPRVKLGYRAHAPEVWVKFTATGRTREETEAELAPAVSEARARVGEWVFAEDDQELPSVVHALLRGKGLRLGAAESCTGGLLSELVTSQSGSSDYFQGAIVSYSNELKQSLLGVERSLLDSRGAVSRECAEAMAQGVLERLSLDLAVAITGIAGPSGGSNEKPVGLVHLALAWRDASGAPRVVAVERRFRGDRARVQRAAALTGLDLVRRHVLGLPQIPVASG